MSLRIKRNYSIAVLIFAVFIILSYACSITLGEGDRDAYMVPACVVVMTLILYYAFKGLCKSRMVVLAVSLSWLFRIVLIPIDIATGLTRQPDQWGFLESAKRIAVGEAGSSNIAWINFINVEYTVFGISPFIVKLSNAFIGMIGIAIVMRCMREMKLTHRTYNMMSVILALSPMTILHGVTALREPVYYLSVSISVYCLWKWCVSGRTNALIAALLALVPAIYFHNGHIFIAIAYVVMFFVYKRRNRSKRIIIFVPIICVVVALLFHYAGSIKGGYFGALLDPNGIVEGFIKYVSSSNGYNSNGNSSYLIWTVNVAGLPQIILYTPLRMLYFIFGPMVWDVRRAEDALAVVCDSTIFLYLAYMLLKIRRRYGKKKSELKMIMPERWMFLVIGVFTIVIFSVPFAWGTITYGTAIRHRNCLLPLVCILIGICRDFLYSRHTYDFGNEDVRQNVGGYL